MELTLTPGERDYLEATLEAALATLRDEIHHADSSTFKASLKAELEMVRGLLERVRAGETVAVGAH